MVKEWQLYTTVRDAWEAMYRACEQAEGSIDFETYIFNDDEIGKRFLLLLKRKAAEGVRVRLLLDAVGSIKLQLTWPLNEFADAGIQVRFFRMLSPWRLRTFGKWLFRDHRKLLVVDSKIGFTGGVGINESMREWRDTQVEIKGPVVADMQEAFELMWKITRTGKFLFAGRPEYHPDGFRFMTNSPSRKQRYFYYEFLGRVREAKKRICITTPYFFPDADLFDLLKRKARANVDVQVLVGKHSDLWLVDQLSKLSFNLLLEAGVKIWQYQGAVIHAKTILVDDWATAGSTNTDLLGLLFNYECNLAGIDAEFVGDMEKQFSADCGRSERMTLGKWKRRPLLEKAFDFFLWPIRWFL